MYDLPLVPLKAIEAMVFATVLWAVVVCVLEVFRSAFNIIFHGALPPNDYDWLEPGEKDDEESKKDE
jgi:hypothetical protein